MNMVGKIAVGPSCTKSTSTFTGYVCDVETFDDVNMAYEWVKFQNLNAQHIVSACRLPSTNSSLGFEYQDDGEHGAGKILLSYMESAQLDNRAIFVARAYDGQHIGQARFEYLLKAAKSVVNQKNYNRVSGCYQFSWPKTGRGCLTGASQVRRLLEASNS